MTPMELLPYCGKRCGLLSDAGVTGSGYLRAVTRSGFAIVSIAGKTYKVKASQVFIKALSGLVIQHINDVYGCLGQSALGTFFLS